jgi:predicted branched-subunit amino acid permease
MSVNRRRLFIEALRYSFPVFLGYLAIGSAFGFMLADQGYPWWLALVMCVFMYAGAGQYIAVGLFAAGTTLWEAVLVQLVVNARHIAYGLSMMNRLKGAGPLKFYIIFGLTDETFALLSSLPPEGPLPMEELPPPENDNGHFSENVAERNPQRVTERTKLMFLVTLLDHSYWILGGVIGAIAGTLIPFSTEGIGYALTSLFIVLMLEQIRRLRKPGVFIASAVTAVLCTLFLPSRISLLAAMALSLAIGAMLPPKRPTEAGEAKEPERGGSPPGGGSPPKGGA